MRNGNLSYSSIRIMNKKSCEVGVHYTSDYLNNKKKVIQQMINQMIINKTDNQIRAVRTMTQSTARASISMFRYWGVTLDAISYQKKKNIFIII